MIKVDCLGEMCPVPLLKFKSEMQQIENGETVMFVTDHSCAKTNITNYCEINKLNYEINEVLNGVWEITVNKKNG